MLSIPRRNSSTFMRPVRPRTPTERIHEQLPVGELVLSAIYRLVGRPPSTIVHGTLHAPIVTPALE